MRHLTASRKGEGGGWHYVNLGRSGGYPLGYCAQHEPHATERDARECYAQYQRDHVELRRDAWTNWSDCRECGAPTKHSATIAGDGYAFESLCEEHLTVDLAIKHLGLSGPAGDSWVS